MRGYESIVTEIRKKVFTEVARLAYEGGDYSRIEALPYKLVPGETNANRSSIFLSRAIAGERVRHLKSGGTIYERKIGSPGSRQYPADKRSENRG